MSCHRLLLIGFSSGLLLLGAAPTYADVMPLPGGPRLSDCNKARDPQRCEARLEARRACSDKRGDNKRVCMDAYVVSPDCARADHPKRCIAQKNAEHACAGKQGKAHKTCMQAQLKKKPAKATKTAAGSTAKPAARTQGSPVSRQLSDTSTG